MEAAVNMINQCYQVEMDVPYMWTDACDEMVEVFDELDLWSSMDDEEPEVAGLSVVEKEEPAEIVVIDIFADDDGDETDDEGDETDDEEDETVAQATEATEFMFKMHEHEHEHNHDDCNFITALVGVGSFIAGVVVTRTLHKRKE